MAVARAFPAKEQNAVLGRLDGDLIVCSVFVTETKTEAQISVEVKLPGSATPALVEKLKAAAASAVDSITLTLAGE